MNNSGWVDAICDTAEYKKNNITLDEIIRVCQFKITEGSEFLWQCYGKHARFLEFGDNISVVFDTENQVVYEANIALEDSERCFRWLNPRWADKYRDECKSCGLDQNTAWGDVEYIDLDVKTFRMILADAISYCNLL